MSPTDEGKSSSYSGYLYKRPIFDGERPSEFKDWWDNVKATLEMEDIEEYITDDFKGVDMPTKD